MCRSRARRDRIGRAAGGATEDPSQHVACGGSVETSDRKDEERSPVSMFLDDEIGGTTGPWFYKKLEVLIVFLDRRLKRECAMTGDYYAGNTRKSLP